jgi:hypothetical protein
MVEYWSKTFTRDGDVEITSCVTRIARNMGLLDGVLINYISAEREELMLDHFLQANLLREDKRESTLYMIYAGYVNEIRLPNPKYWLANVDHFTIPLKS